MAIQVGAKFRQHLSLFRLTRLFAGIAPAEAFMTREALNHPLGFEPDRLLAIDDRNEHLDAHLAFRGTEIPAPQR